MGVFERMIQERQPAAASVALTPRHAFAAVVIAAFNADGRVAPEEAARVHEFFRSTKLFRHQPAESAQAVVEQAAELLRAHGVDVVLPLVANALPAELRTPAFAVAVDVVLADGEATIEERKFIDGLQTLLEISDEQALKIIDVLLIKNSV